MALEKWYRIKESPSKPTTKCEDTGVFSLIYELADSSTKCNFE
jgi:hypothetical protein